MAGGDLQHAFVVGKRSARRGEDQRGLRTSQATRKSVCADLARRLQHGGQLIQLYHRGTFKHRYSDSVLQVALTVMPPNGSAPRDIVVRAGGQRLVSELASDIAEWLDLPPSTYGLVVQRTGEHLIPERRLDQVDVREGDTLLLLAQGETMGSRAPRRGLRHFPQQGKGYPIP